MLPGINASTIETENLFNLSMRNCSENSYDFFSNSHVIKLSTTSTTVVSEVGTLLRINSKIPKFDVHEVPNVESFYPTSHGIKDEKSVQLNSKPREIHEELFRKRQELQRNGKEAKINTLKDKVSLREITKTAKKVSERQGWYLILYALRL